MQCSRLFYDKNGKALRKDVIPSVRSLDIHHTQSSFSKQVLDTNDGFY